MVDWRVQEAVNETVFREMNEWTRNALDEGEIAGLLDRYLCECSDRRCTDPIELTKSEYEAVRAEPITFVIARNHENPEIDRVLSEHERFTVLGNVGFAARIARASDPRRYAAAPPMHQHARECVADQAEPASPIR